jgi:hypothetical protein
VTTLPLSGAKRRPPKLSLLYRRERLVTARSWKLHRPFLHVQRDWPCRERQKPATVSLLPSPPGSTMHAQHLRQLQAPTSLPVRQDVSFLSNTLCFRTIMNGKRRICSWIKSASATQPVGIADAALFSEAAAVRHAPPRHRSRGAWRPTRSLGFWHVTQTFGWPSGLFR